MKIAFILEDLMVGGAQRHTVALSQKLPASFTPVFVNLSGQTAEPYAKLASLNFSGVAIDRPADWRKVGAAVAALEPDVIVCINQITALWMLIGRLIGAIKSPVVIIFHSTQIGSLAGWVRTLPFMVLAPIADRLVYISANQQKVWRGRGLRARRSVLIRNGIDPAPFAPATAEERRDARARFGFDDSDAVIGLAAVFRREKNHVQLIDALALLRQQGLSAKVLLIGDGPKRAEIEARVAALSLGDAVVFAGMQKNVRSCLAAVDIGVLCSTAIETLSLSALEALAMGIPMVMSDIGGASEIIEPGVNGYLFPAGDTPALAARLRDGLAPERRSDLSAQAARTVQASFSHAAMVADYVQMFQDLIKRRS